MQYQNYNMKYLIKESQFDNVIFSFLDSQEFTSKEGKSSFYFTDKPSSNDAIILYWEGSGLCTINYEIISIISSLFSLTEFESQELIGKWVENKLGLDVNETSAFDDEGFRIVKKTH